MNLIVAHCRNRGIGFEKKLPWMLSKDMKRFKDLTIGKGKNAVIMGRNTWLSLPLKYRPLPKRENIILTTKLVQNQHNNNMHFLSSLSAAEEYCISTKIDDSWIIGGEMLYKESLQSTFLKKIYVTHIDKDYDCDTFFPEIPDCFALDSKTDWMIENNTPYRYELYTRKKYIENPGLYFAK